MAAAVAMGLAKMRSHSEKTRFDVTPSDLRQLISPGFFLLLGRTRWALNWQVRGPLAYLGHRDLTPCILRQFSAALPLGAPLSGHQPGLGGPPRPR